MKYYYDTEFLEGSQTKRIFGIPYGKTAPTIDLISIGIVSEDNREYYAISKDFNLKEAWNRYDVKVETMSGDMRNVFPEGRKAKVYWIRENVLKKIFDDIYSVKNGFPEGKEFNYKNMKRLLKLFGTTNKQIAHEIKTFTGVVLSADIQSDGTYMLNKISQDVLSKRVQKAELYGYYSAYDHVVFCWLFGKMINLPKGFPMYTIDLKQMIDEVANSFSSIQLSNLLHPHVSTEHNVFAFLDEQGTLNKLHELKSHSNYPKETNAHNALADAKWTKQLHEFIESVK